jgi:hypothetical protein
MMFTRYSNAKRHNLNIHQNNGTIVATTDYIIGISQGRYRPPVDSLIASRNRRRGGAKRMSSLPPSWFGTLWEILLPIWLQVISGQPQ